jgi:hypothetical protein
MVWEVVQARSRFGVDLISHEQTALIGRELELDPHSRLSLACVRSARRSY